MRARCQAGGVPSDPTPIVSPVLVARLICSDPACAEGAEEHAESVEELHAFACHCGCGLEVLHISEAVLLDPPQGAGPHERLVLLAA